MRTYSQVKAEVQSILNEAGMDDWSVYPGPDLPAIPSKFVVCSPYGGPGTDLDGAIDQRSWQFRVVGGQNDFESAEAAADAIDIAFLSHYARKVQGTWVPQIQRAGGAPAVLLVDDAERTHFVCSYIIDVALALTH